MGDVSMAVTMFLRPEEMWLGGSKPVLIDWSCGVGLVQVWLIPEV